MNHPNLLALFDIGQHNGSPFLVSELLEGESLRAVPDRGVVPRCKTFEYGVQVAHGIEPSCSVAVQFENCATTSCSYELDIAA